MLSCTGYGAINQLGEHQMNAPPTYEKKLRRLGEGRAAGRLHGSHADARVERALAAKRRLGFNHSRNRRHLPKAS
jgi:hypothetical protein